MTIVAVTMTSQPTPERTVPLIDGNGQRAQLVGQAVLVLSAWLLDWWALVALTGVVLGVGALRWPQWAVFVRLQERLIAPRVPAVPPTDGRPPRFSAALGAVTLPMVAAVIAGGFATPGWTLALVGAGAALAEAVRGKCAPCEFFVWAARRNLIRLAAPLVDR